MFCFHTNDVYYCISCSASHLWETAGTITFIHHSPATSPVLWERLITIAPIHSLWSSTARTSKFIGPVHCPNITSHYLSCPMTKPTKWLCTEQRQISLGICPVWSESSLCAQWVAKDPNFLHTDSEEWSDWADAQADLSLRWVHMPFCWFCHEVAHLRVRWRGQWRRGSSYKGRLYNVLKLTFDNRILRLLRLIHINMSLHTTKPTECPASAQSDQSLHYVP